MLFTVLIPIYQPDIDRKRNLEFIYNRLIDHYSEDEIEIIFGIQDIILDEYYLKFDRAIIKHYRSLNRNSFNKSIIFNSCINEGINGQFLVFLDSDIYFPFQKLKDQLDNMDLVIRPFSECIFLDEVTTNEFVNNKKAIAAKELKRISATGGGCIILNRNILSNIRMDENFVGWGWEDIDLGNMLSKKFEIKVLNQHAVHLYHKSASINRDNQKYYNYKYKYIHKPYNLNTKKDIEIIISYFSPCDYKKPRVNLYKTLDSLANTECQITVVEAVLPNSTPLNISDRINHIQLEANAKNILFLKENLYNIGIKNTNKKKILFLDADLLFDNINFIDDSSCLLDEYDIIQPFDLCVWMDENYVPLLDHNYRHSIAKAMFHNKHIDGINHHPGFAWGMTRKFLESCQGFYDKVPIGAGDSAFSYAISNNDDYFSNIIKCFDNIHQFFIYTNSFKQYKNRIKKYNPKIGYLHNCICYHMYHGSRKNRDYVDRSKKYLPCLVNDEYPITYNNGLLEWIDENNAIKCLEYFKSRLEDD